MAICFDSSHGHFDPARLLFVDSRLLLRRGSGAEFRLAEVKLPRTDHWIGRPSYRRRTHDHRNDSQRVYRHDALFSQDPVSPSETEVRMKYTPGHLLAIPYLAAVVVSRRLRA